MNDAGLFGENIWLCSRVASSSYWGVRYLEGDGTLQKGYFGKVYDWLNGDPIYDYYSNYNTNTRYTYTYGLRPIVSLKSEIKITGGSGTADDPYTISI